MTSFKLSSKLFAAALAAMALVFMSFSPAYAAPKKDFKVGWSIYVGWMPWGYAQDNGIVKKWADKYGLNIELVQFNDYIEGINQFTAGAYDGIMSTNMDALAIPSAGGVDSTILIICDYSNGNDVIILKDKDALEDIKGQKVNLVELSVSHYTLARGLESVGMSEKDVTVVNTSDADMIAAWGTNDVTAMVTWNPMAAEILTGENANNVFDSEKLPGEIQDSLVVNTKTLEENPDFGKAMTGIWYETMALMSADNEAAIAAKTAMGTASGTDLEGYEAQLAATEMFYTPQDYISFAESDLEKTTTFVTKFLFDHGLLGQDATSPGYIGIELADGKVVGNADNVLLRYTTEYAKLAADGKL
ncbi:putative transport protein [Parvibaculum lavamentivorans DS-1]|uniref:Putative transport protein n=1 Tax=Parvibaculum lavamentivorans (strain DS-1 / DSM 13023 / NCIMB 13966) TaxID=402881 RepID=A7HUB9_PARL1|nr:putative urea ABC transporter substrate-binding protein [Parvibaculum lavamentivorans]ABS63502.1 putative transport protein [Parvibaculum lavamentivorans DS-1]